MSFTLYNAWSIN